MYILHIWLQQNKFSMQPDEKWDFLVLDKNKHDEHTLVAHVKSESTKLESERKKTSDIGASKAHKN